MSNRLSPASPASSRLRQRIAVGVVSLVILVAAAWLALIIVSRIDELFFPGQGIGRLPSLPGVQRDQDGPKEPINVLVMGLDRRPREGDQPTRTDTMFVLTVDPRSKTAGILGIPRDLWVDIPAPDAGGPFEERINTAYAIGEQNGYPGGGPALAEEVVEQNLGIPIDHYVIIDFEGFIEVIDSLDGIDVFVEEEIDDPFYSRTELPGDYYPLHFEVGRQHMDGQTALDYARTRFDSNDLDRIQRQQKVIFAAIDKAVDRDLTDIDSLTGLWSRYKDAIQTDVNDIQAPGFAALAAQIDPERIAAVSIGAATTPWTTPEGAQVLLVDKQMVQELVQAVFSDRRLREEAAQVEVQNGAGTAGLASDVVGYLAASGFSRSSLTVADGSQAEALPLTVIIDFSDKDYTVERLAALLAVSPDQIREGGADDRSLVTAENTDILVILGADAQARDFSAGAPSGETGS